MANVPPVQADDADIDIGAPQAPDQGNGIDPDESRRLAKFWQSQLDEVNDQFRKWFKRGRMVEKRYRDERNRVDEEGQRRFNSLWMNVETLRPVLYGRPPVPYAERRFRDKDPVGRSAAQILERALRNEIEINGLNEATEQAVQDYLLPGRGVVWVRYEPELEESVSIPVENVNDFRDAQGEIQEEDDSPNEIKLRDTGDRIIRESVPVDYIQWSDFFTFPARARTWKEVTAIAKRVYLSKDQIKDRWGKELADKIPMEKDDRERRRQNESVIPEDESSRKAQVYEIWSRSDERVYWICEGLDELIDRVDDPLELEGFYPVPRPLFANLTNNTLEPVPDYLQYQDQAIQIDELTQRIAMLTKACKVAGVYNARAKDVIRLLDESVENELIPVDDWAAFAEKGGVAGNMSLLPLKEIIGVINELNGILDRQMQQMNLLTGITDIMRGTTDARETMGAQRLKTNNSATRVQRRQAEVARFVRDTIRLMAEIMSMHFSPQSLIQVSGALFEEGLGADAMPSMSQTQPPMPGQPPGLPMRPSPSPAGAAGGLPPAAPPGPAASPGGAPIPGQPPGAPPGNNVVPFRGPPPPVPAQAAVGGPPPTPPSAVGPGGPPPHPPGAPPPGMPPGQAPVPVPPGSGAPGLPGLGQPQIPPGLMRIIQAIKLLRDEKLRGFRVEIETDSTIAGDNQQEKADRIEFIGMTTKFLETAIQLSGQMPEIAPLMGKILQFGVRGFKTGRDLEAAIEDFCDMAEQKARQMAANPQPNPAQVKAQAEAQRNEIEMQKGRTDLQLGQMKIGSEKMKAQAEVARQAVENQGEQANAQMDMAAKQEDAKVKMIELEMEKLKLQIELARLHGQAHQQQHDQTMAVHNQRAEAQQAALQPPPTGPMPGAL